MCYTYDNLSRVTNRTIKNECDNVISSENFTYDAAGNITDEIRKLLGHEVLIEVSSARSGVHGNIGLYITANTHNNDVTSRESIEKIDGIFFVIAE